MIKYNSVNRLLRTSLNYKKLQQAQQSKSFSSLSFFNNQHHHNHTNYLQTTSKQQYTFKSFYSTSSDLIPITFIDKDGKRIELNLKEGTSLLEAAHDNDIDLEGACEGSVACSTCHVYIEPKFFEKLEEPTDEENDMLDLAFDLKTNSRLGCQIKVTKDLAGMEVSLPMATRNMSVDGYKPKHH